MFMFHKVATNTELENIFEEVIANSFPNLMKTLHHQIQENQQISGKRKVNTTTPRYIILNLLKISEKENLKGSQRKKDIILKRTKKNQHNPEHSEEMSVKYWKKNSEWV